MKKLSFLLILALLLTLGASAFADNGVEIIYMDGIPVVMESIGLSLSDNETFDAQGEGFKLPTALVEIGEEAFAGIPASRVVITANVKTIGPRAFADCENLQELVIPKTVTSIDNTALEGCKGVTVYGEIGSEAERFSQDNDGIMFAAWDETIAPPDLIPAQPPVVLPYVPFN